MNGLSKEDIAVFFGSVVDFICAVGLVFTEGASRVFRTLFNIIKAPVMLLANGVMFLFGSVWNFFRSSYKEQIGGEKYFTGRMMRAVRRTLSQLRSNPRIGIYLIGYYFRKGKMQYRRLIKYVLVILLPLLAGVTAFMTVSHFSRSCVALKIATAEETLGYVADEKDYIQARDMARKRLSLDPENRESSSRLLPKVTYTLEKIDANRYTSISELCNRLILNSSVSVVNACGIYVDGEFLCAVKNETQAKRVFNSILEASPDYGKEGIVTFVEDIDYIDGLYPDSPATLWNTEKLEKHIFASGNKSTRYTAKTDDTLESVAASNGLTVGELVLLNPGYSAETELSEGEQLVVKKADKLLTVKTVKTEIENNTTPFATVEIPSDALYAGAKRTIVSGRDGVEQVTNLVTYIDGKRVSRAQVSKLVLNEPVAKRVQVGTKPLDSQYNYKSFGGVLLWPAVNAFNINSPYGPRWGKIHRAIDIGSSVGTSLGKFVVAAAVGTVVISGTHSSYGYYVKIDHGNGMQTLYAHCIPGSLMVSVGDRVDAGQPIARIGQSGYATGPHLHFEVIIDGNAVDPSPYLGLT